MRALERIRDLQKMSLFMAGSYTVNYEYDAKGRIRMERVSGDIERTTEYQYDDNDNIVKEIYNDGSHIVTRDYGYENANIKTMTVTTTIAE